MKIRVTQPIANRHRGDLVDLDDESAAFVIAHGYAERVDDDPERDEPAPDDTSTRRTRTRTARGDDHPPSQKVGDDPRPKGADTGTS